MTNAPLDATTFAAQRDQALARFGAMLQAWRVRNGWTQHTAHQWATSAGFRMLTAGNLSKLERGLAGNPSPSTIFQLADMNARIAGQQWGTVRDRHLRQRIEQAQPIVDDDGQICGPTEFWAASVGIQPLPADLVAPDFQQPPDINDEGAAALSEEWRQAFVAAVIAHDLDPSEEVQAVARLVPVEHRRRLRQVLSLPGCSFTADELLQQWANGWRTAQAIEQWVQQLHDAAISQGFSRS